MSEKIDIEALRDAVIRLENKIDEVINYLDSNFGNIEYFFPIKTIYSEKTKLFTDNYELLKTYDLKRDGNTE